MIPSCYILADPEIKSTKNQHYYINHDHIAYEYVQQQVAHKCRQLKNKLKNADSWMAWVLQELRQFIFDLEVL